MSCRGVVLAHRWRFSAWLAVAAEARLGVKVTIGSIHWALLPTPAIVITDFRTQQEQPVIIGRLRIGE